MFGQKEKRPLLRQEGNPFGSGPKEGEEENPCRQHDEPEDKKPCPWFVYVAGRCLSTFTGHVHAPTTYSTVTLLARFLGLSMSLFRNRAQ